MHVQTHTQPRLRLVVGCVALLGICAEIVISIGTESTLDGTGGGLAFP